MHSSELPLPLSDEVLICDEQTSFEEVELLLRRAIQTDKKNSESTHTYQHVTILILTNI